MTWLNYNQNLVNLDRAITVCLNPEHSLCISDDGINNVLEIVIPEFGNPIIAVGCTQQYEPHHPHNPSIGNAHTIPKAWLPILYLAIKVGLAMNIDLIDVDHIVNLIHVLSQEDDAKLHLNQMRTFDYWKRYYE